MHLFFAKAVISSFLILIGWQNDFQTATRVASEKHQLILLNFSGSDWCGPCIRMRKEIFSDSSFLKMADTSLVMYNADFPRNKKNLLPAMLKKQNESLADKYNPQGNFPLTVLLTAKGKVINTWIGLPAENMLEFTSAVKKICNTYAGTPYE